MNRLYLLGGGLFQAFEGLFEAFDLLICVGNFSLLLFRRGAILKLACHPCFDFEKRLFALERVFDIAFCVRFALEDVILELVDLGFDAFGSADV